ncbi:hypothetical protein ACFQ46_03170 [Kineococcus sp. GCM10028916]|uniref:hypothetical protein n=1 Tax=Kineococcus sp. GCM10028916 TaxID=3273394 RepID=UPI00362BA1DF
MSEPFTQPIAGPVAPDRSPWWQKPIVAIATVVVVTGLTGGVAYAATRGDAGGGTTQEQSGFPGGGQFGRHQQVPPGQVPGGTQQGQTWRGAGAPTT